MEEKDQKEQELNSLVHSHKIFLEEKQRLLDQCKALQQDIQTWKIALKGHLFEFERIRFVRISYIMVVELMIAYAFLATSFFRGGFILFSICLFSFFLTLRSCYLPDSRNHMAFAALVLFLVGVILFYL